MTPKALAGGKAFVYTENIMNEKVLKTLEYTKIIERLDEKCSTSMGHAKAAALRPMDDAEQIAEAQEETAAALSRIIRFGSISCSGAHDIRDSIARLKIQASLGIVELLHISALLKAVLRVRSFGDHKDREEETDVLDRYFAALQPLTPLRNEIDRCIISEEEIADDASSNLHSIRRKMQSTGAKVRSELNRILISESQYLRDNLITMRNGRYCIPVKSEYRSQVAGMIHDESGSGSTVFIEPMAVVKLNNEIRELEIEEQKEIEVILAKLSAQAADYVGMLETNVKVMGHLDLVFAKASLARDMNASKPVFNHSRKIVLKSARHPLLDRKTVVPIDLTLGDAFHQLIVTGPNTGGKTVSLKTVGLLQLMGQAGLHIPALDGSELGIFTQVYADIGDEQSIEQSLSTFSSHMKNIVGILKHADNESLVLLDELCSGTDPQEGAALAIAILKFLKRFEIRTMATTHYSELKLYALSTEGVENASCEFDVATLSPTYRLLIGIPGKSNAFAISKRLGLPSYIIDDARAGIDEDAARFEDIIKDLNDSRRQMEREKSKIGQLKGEAKKLNDELKTRQDKLAAEREAILKKAREEARDILQDAKNQVDETIRQINKAGKDTRELEKVRANTRELLDKNTEKTVVQKQKSGTKADELHIGDRIKVLSMNLEGTVSSLPDQKGNLFVQMGILRSQVHLNDVVRLQEATISYKGSPVGGTVPGTLSHAKTISHEINLIGKTVDEALPELDQYLDDAYLSHLPSVRIVHGKGSGALRNAVHSYLRKQSFIKGFHLGEYGEGDAGVTIAEFK